MSNKTDYSDLQRLVSRRAYAGGLDPYRTGGRRSPGVPPPRRPRRGRWLPGLVVLLLLAAGWGVHYVWSKPQAAESSAANIVGQIDGEKQRQAARQAAAAKAAKAAAAKATETFAGQVNAIIAANPSISFSVSTITAASGPKHYGTGDTFLGASTTKLITAADFFHHVEAGSDSLDETIAGSSAQHLLEIMIVNSDDTAWDELNNYLTYPGLQAYARSIGLTSFDSAQNSVTSDDIANILNQIYNGSLLSPAHRSLLLGWMKEANYRQYVVPAVPADDTIYHKIGLYLDNVHDATIITHGSHWLILVIYTDGHGTQDWTGRAGIMQAIARDAIADFLPPAASPSTEPSP